MRPFRRRLSLSNIASAVAHASSVGFECARRRRYDGGGASSPTPLQQRIDVHPSSAGSQAPGSGASAAAVEPTDAARYKRRF